MLALLALLAAVFLGRAGALIAGQSPEDAVRVDLLVVTAGALLGGIGIRRLYLAPAALFAVAYAVASAMPEHSLDVALVSSALALWTVVLAPRRGERPILDVFEREP